MRLPSTAHTSRPWRIHEIAPDFHVEDVWVLPTPGGPDELPLLARQFAEGPVVRPGSSPVVRFLFAVRWKLGAALGWDRPETGLGARVPTLLDRLPADLREGPRGPSFPDGRFTSLYLTQDEWAAEMANKTVHGILHLGWVPDGPAGSGRHRAHMTVLVKPNGLGGAAYMAAIKPFRYLGVYPALLRSVGRAWATNPARTSPVS
ncbi:hypothetical protein GCM10010218_30300 [Streptomyces mashuensis]|uniref:DUF2867 domain-containing protein n=1 Tax=Streptomyces mashuensis TaxID=33904 RepID=A0A919B2W6_9ACTN|nr:DUF2867 domain-containing protein [Streptomyces mashuensis]GHF46953.1 hypothetical protein GCM10010218_30300 [Streptomyces mashuensis]